MGKPAFVIGLDLGTSGVKAMLVSAEGELVAEAAAPLEASRPRPQWSGQAPADWLAATDQAMQSLRSLASVAEWQSVHALAAADQMHGAVLLDAAEAALRPAILWNDGRSQLQCAELEAHEPATRRITANRAMAGFTAPKLMWVAAHEPTVFARVAKVLLPKDWLVWQLAGVMSSDCSDAAGTLWLEVAGRRRSGTMLATSGMRANQIPALHEGPQPVGALLPRWTAHWGLPADIRVAAGGVRDAAPLFLPHLSGERTPHADPGATGSFHGPTHQHSRDDMGYAVLEGVAFAFTDSMAAPHEAGSVPKRLLAIGGGARSDTWLQLLADTLAMQIDRPAGAEVGPALGAARLALMRLGASQDEVVHSPSLAQSFSADAARSTALQTHLARYRAAYAPLRALS